MSGSTIVNWTDEQCKLLEPLWNLARARRDSHHIAYRFYNTWHTVVNLPPILLGAILSTISLKPEAVPAGISAGLAVLITGMSTVNTFFEFSKSREGHRQCYRAFNGVVRDIELNIIRGREAPKMSFVDFLESINDQFSKITEGAPTLNKNARRMLDGYRGARPSPFEQLLKGDKEATGYDPFMDREPYVESVDGDRDGAADNLVVNISGGSGSDDKHLEPRPVDDSGAGVVAGVASGAGAKADAGAGIKKNLFPDTVALNVFNEQIAGGLLDKSHPV